jgi:hypothetical protein
MVVTIRVARLSADMFRNACFCSLRSTGITPVPHYYEARKHLGRWQSTTGPSLHCPANNHIVDAARKRGLRSYFRAPLRLQLLKFKSAQDARGQSQT